MNRFEAAFNQPGAAHSACPLWFWNGDLEPQELLRQMALMHQQGVLAFVIHARRGLEVEYLSETWFARCGLVIEEAARLGMKLWIYDEDNWPSGYAGGRVLERNPDNIGQNLGLERHYLEGPSNFDLTLERPSEVRFVLVAQILEVVPIPPDPLTFHGGTPVANAWSDTTRHRHVYGHEAARTLEPDVGRLCWQVPAGRWCLMVARQRPTDWIAAYSNHHYADLMNDAATSAFLEETHEQYFKRFGSYFGSTVLGFFVDEPGLYNNFWDRNLGTLSWTHDFAVQFEARRGYAITPWLHALWEGLGTQGQQVRADYWQTVAELLDQRFFAKLANWCAAHGVQLTGHLEWEEWLFTMTRHSANPFTALRPFHVPGLDRIDEVYEKLAEKLVASVAHANGRSRVLSETFAITGWKLAPPYMKQIIDYQYVRGVNWLVPHGFFYSTDDFRKRECPPSEFFQNPWWDHSRPLWRYVSRLSSLLSTGDHVASVLLYYPIEHAWATMTPDAPSASPPAGIWEAWQLPNREHPTTVTDLALLELGLGLLKAQFDFDLIDHSTLEASRLDAARLRSGSGAFRVVVVPPLEVMFGPALQRMLAFANGGGTVFFTANLPERLIGVIPPGWAAAREALSKPGVVPWGSGRLGLNAGTQATIVELGQVISADPEVHVIGREGEWLVSQSNRPYFKDTNLSPPRAALRSLHRRAGETHLYFLVNESQTPLELQIKLEGTGVVEQWFADSGRRVQLEGRTGNNQIELKTRFEAWESKILVVQPGTPNGPTRPKHSQRLLIEGWRLELDGLDWSGGLQSWAALGKPFFSGQGTYRVQHQFDQALHTGARILLDLGAVFETAQVSVNGTRLEALAWSPYRQDITDHVRTGGNEIEVVVANTNANSFEHRERTSGLLGPVHLILEHAPPS